MLEQLQHVDPNRHALCPLFVYLGWPDGRARAHFHMGRPEHPTGGGPKFTREAKRTNPKRGTDNKNRSLIYNN